MISENGGFDQDVGQSLFIYSRSLVFILNKNFLYLAKILYTH